MTRLDIGARFFQVEFRHTRNLTHVKAITTCVILATDFESEPPGVREKRFTAIGNAICWPADSFSRRTGRLKAFANALDHCGPLRAYKLPLFAAYMVIDPDPPRRVREKLSEQLKKARWEAGWEKRIERAQARGGISGQAVRS